MVQNSARCVHVQQRCWAAGCCHRASKDSEFNEVNLKEANECGAYIDTALKNIDVGKMSVKFSEA